MRGSEHIAIAVVPTLIAVAATGQTGESLLAPAVVAAIGALAPDLDHRGSLASFGIPSSLMAYGVVVVFAVPFVKQTANGQAILGAIPYLPLLQQAAWIAIALSIFIGILSLVVRGAFNHRGPFHSLAFGLLSTFVIGVPLLATGLPGGLVIAFAWGWLSHLAADATTKMGVPSLWWPFDPTTRSNVTSAFESVSLLAGKLRSFPLSRSASQVMPEVRKQPDLRSSRPVLEPRHTTSRTPLCPRCGTPMVKRTAKRGGHQGEQFYGCVNFPKCRGTRPLR